MNLYGLNCGNGHSQKKSSSSCGRLCMEEFLLIPLERRENLQMTLLAHLTAKVRRVSCTSFVTMRYQNLCGSALFALTLYLHLFLLICRVGSGGMLNMALAVTELNNGHGSDFFFGFVCWIYGNLRAVDYLKRQLSVPRM